MKNKNDIVFADGSIIKAGCLEYLSSTYHTSGYAVHEFREVREFGDGHPGSELLIQMQKETNEYA